MLSPAAVDSEGDRPPATGEAGFPPSRRPSVEGVNVQTAFALHKAGRCADAARVYHSLLERDPDDPAVLHLFGVVHHQCGPFARAAELIGRAIAPRPDAVYHANLAEALRALGRHEEAAASCRTAPAAGLPGSPQQPGPGLA